MTTALQDSKQALEALQKKEYVALSTQSEVCVLCNIYIIYLYIYIYIYQYIYIHSCVCDVFVVCMCVCV